jgi:hypothetical protein
MPGVAFRIHNLGNGWGIFSVHLDAHANEYPDFDISSICTELLGDCSHGYAAFVEHSRLGRPGELESTGCLGNFWLLVPFS